MFLLRPSAGLVMAVFNAKTLFDSVVAKFTTTVDDLSIYDTTNVTGGRFNTLRVLLGPQFQTVSG